MARLSYPPEVRYTMIKLWQKNYTGSEIATKIFEKFGIEVTRSAVIGFLWRKGYSRNAK